MATAVTAYAVGSAAISRPRANEPKGAGEGARVVARRAAHLRSVIPTPPDLGGNMPLFDTFDSYIVAADETDDEETETA
jgi:hypothetical protein